MNPNPRQLDMLDAVAVTPEWGGPIKTLFGIDCQQHALAEAGRKGSRSPGRRHIEH